MPHLFSFLRDVGNSGPPWHIFYHATPDLFSTLEKYLVYLATTYINCRSTKNTFPPHTQRLSFEHVQFKVHITTPGGVVKSCCCYGDNTFKKHMFRRKKSRVAPEEDTYVKRRYEDLTECIHRDIANNRGLLCYYSTWLDFMMVKFSLPDEFRKRHSLAITDSEGRHIGCSGAVNNTLKYFNPISPAGHKDLSQSHEAIRKSRLSAKLTDTRLRVAGGGEDDSGDTNDHKTTNNRKTVKLDVGPYGSSAEGDSSAKCHDDQNGAGTSSESGREKCKNEASESLKFAQKSSNPLNHCTDPVDKPSSSRIEPFVTVDGTQHKVHTQSMGTMLTEILRPDSANSYHVRIDEAFRKHKESSSKTAWEKTEEEAEIVDETVDETKETVVAETKDTNPRTNTLVIGTEDQSNTQSSNSKPSNTRKSKICTIL